MSPESKNILAANLHHWHSVRDSGTVHSIAPTTVQQLLNVLRAEWEPSASCCLHCGGDICNMIRKLYSYYEKEIKEDAPLNV
jgi:hypothetical protein